MNQYSDFTDRLMQNIDSTGKMSSRYLVFSTLISLVLMGSALDVIGLGDEASFLGMSISAEGWALEIIFSWILLVVYINMFNLMLHEVYLNRCLVRILKEIGGYPTEFLDQDKWSATRYPNPTLISIYSGKKIFFQNNISEGFAFIAVSIVLLLPVIAQGLVANSIGNEFGRLSIQHFIQAGIFVVYAFLLTVNVNWKDIRSKT